MSFPADAVTRSERASAIAIVKLWFINASACDGVVVGILRDAENAQSGASKSVSKSIRDARAF